MKTFTYLLILTALISLAGCSDNPVKPTESSGVTVSGTITVWECPGWSPIYNYSEHTGKPATITLTGSDGIGHVVLSDAHSRFSVAVDSGLYSITLSTFHMQPESYGVIYLERDTSEIELRSVIAYTPDDLVTASFYYPNSDTANTEQQERQALEFLSEQMHGVLNVRQATRKLPEYSNGFVYYENIAVRADVPAWQAAKLAAEIVQNQPSHFPFGCSILPYYRPCFS